MRLLALLAAVVAATTAAALRASTVPSGGFATTNGIPALQVETNFNLAVATNAAATPLFSGPLAAFVGSLANLSNLWEVPYCLYDASSGRTGGGVAVLYDASDYLIAGFRLDYVAGTVWMPSVSAHVQAPLCVGNVRLVPFAVSGVATPLSGKGTGNGSAVGVAGAGLAVRIVTASKWRLDFLADAEKWTGFGGLQFRAGLGLSGR